MAAVAADVAVIEVGASPLEPYNGAVTIKEIGRNVRMTILCASDPYAVLGVMSAFEVQPDLVTGIVANTGAGRELVEKLSSVRALNLKEPSALPEMTALLQKEALGRRPLRILPLGHLVGVVTSRDHVRTWSGMVLWLLLQPPSFEELVTRGASGTGGQ